MQDLQIYSRQQNVRPVLKYILFFYLKWIVNKPNNELFCYLQQVVECMIPLSLNFAIISRQESLHDQFCYFSFFSRQQSVHDKFFYFSIFSRLDGKIYTTNSGKLCYLQQISTVIYSRKVYETNLAKICYLQQIAKKCTRPILQSFANYSRQQGVHDPILQKIHYLQLLAKYYMTKCTWPILQNIAFGSRQIAKCTRPMPKYY